MALPVLQSVGTKFVGGGSTLATIPVAPGVVAGHGVCMVLYIESTVAPTALPSGFTEITLDAPVIVTGAQGHYVRLYQMLATASNSGDPDNNGYYDVTMGNTNYMSGVAFRVSGMPAAGSWWDVTNSNIKTTTTDGNTPAVIKSSTVNDCLWILITTTFANGAFTPPGSCTERYDEGEQIAICTKSQAVFGSSGSLVGSYANAGATGAWLGALKPAVSAVDTTKFFFGGA